MIEIYTDGSCWPNDGTGNGTCGFVAVREGKLIHEFVDGRIKTTNNRMELLGVINAILYAMKEYNDFDVKIYSDSQYVVKGYNSWTFKWFEGKGKTNLINRDMWDFLHKLRHPKIHVEWVKGHNICEWNNYIDEICSKEFSRRYKK